MNNSLIMIIVGIIFILIGLILIWFNIPFSPLKSDFNKDITILISDNNISQSKQVYTNEDFSKLPNTIQKYLEHCGYIGKNKTSYMSMEYHDVNFKQGQNGPTLTIDYKLYDFAKPERIAFIDSSVYGVPFEGYDYYKNGTGGMKGVIAKGITLFNQKGAEMDKACLATYLSEILFIPNALLYNNISFEKIDDYNIKAKISYQNQSVNGIFTFNENYEFISFTTNDRAVSGTDGNMEYIPWSAICEDYQKSDEGILHPTKFKAVWHYPKEDFIYFDGKINDFSYGN